MNERLKALADAGVSIWLDDLSRDRITSGNLADLVSSYSVSGVTTVHRLQWVRRRVLHRGSVAHPSSSEQKLLGLWFSTDHLRGDDRSGCRGAARHSSVLAGA